MKKSIFIPCLYFLMVMTTPVLGQDKYTVSGTVEYSGTKDIYILLCNKETFATWKKVLPPAPFTLITKSDQTGKTNFIFHEVPKGDYVMVAFVDINNNGKLDLDAWGMATEPIASSRPILDPMRFITWNDLMFTVDKDLNDIRLKF